MTACGGTGSVAVTEAAALIVIQDPGSDDDHQLILDARAGRLSKQLPDQRDVAEDRPLLDLLTILFVDHTRED